MGISSQLFKFRPVDKHAIDSLVTRRLFLAPWMTLNDAHEAQMFIRAPGFNCHMNPERVSMFAPTLLSFNVTGTRVCSLSRGWASNLLWSHYADGHQGLAIGLSLPANLDRIQIFPVEYSDKLPELRPPIGKDGVLQALRYKSSEWQYEKEMRLVTFDPECAYLSGVEILDVIFGLRTSEDDIAFVRRVAGSSVRFWKVQYRPSEYALDVGDLP
jgi:hypothetical protein